MRRLLRSPAAVDVLLLFMLGSLALYGFRDTYYGWGYLGAGVAGLVLGIALACLTRQLGQPPVVLLALVTLAFFLLGGLVALHDLGGTNVLPVPHTLEQLANCVIHGWKQLLTTLPPVDGGPLLAIPYLLGLLTGSAGVALARGLRWAPAPVFVPIALLALVILLGVQNPRRTALTAAVFAALTIAWLVVRARRSRVRLAVAGSRHVVRRVASVGLCAGVAATGFVAGPHLPGLAKQRVVLRSHVMPPFNVGQYASPLVTFRRFTHGYQTVAVHPGDALYDRPLFKVTGADLPSHSPLRIATLDSYDGNVWGAGNVAGDVVNARGGNVEDTFQKVGRVIDNPISGTPVRATVTILDGTDAPGSSSMNVWLPTAGSLTGITFHRPDQETGSDDFRYNLSASTGVLPEGLARGDSYTFTAVEPGQALTPHTRLASGALPEVDASTFQQLATTWAGKAGDSLAQVRAVAGFLKANGHYTDGEKGYQYFPAGNSLYRLKYFTSSAGQLAGDDEQFAAMMALAANALGVPARVVVGAIPERNGVVEGKDVHAWVELQAADGSWKTLPTTEFMNQRKPQRQQEQQQQAVAASTIPPPAPVHPPATAGAPLDNSLNHRVTAVHLHRFQLPAWVWLLLRFVAVPLLVVVVVCCALVGTKRVRRSRRRTRGLPSRRLALAWRDLLDHARDYGLAVPATATRREQATALTQGDSGVPFVECARRADAVMFGRAEPSVEAVAEFWSEIDRLRDQIDASHSRWQRFRAALSPATFRPPTMSRPRLAKPTFQPRHGEAAIEEAVSA
jgi:transglutaminase-like putative cysteine protease